MGPARRTKALRSAGSGDGRDIHKAIRDRTMSLPATRLPAGRERLNIAAEVDTHIGVRDHRLTADSAHHATVNIPQEIPSP